MTRTTLEEFIAPISKQLGRTAVPDAPLPVAEDVKPASRITDGLSQSQLVDLFVEQAEAIRVFVARTDEAGVAEAVRNIIADPPETDSALVQDGPAVYEDSEALESMGVPAALGPNAVKWDAALGHDALMRACTKARFGVTVATGGIAETGTIVQPCSPQCGRGISLLPLCHIAIVYAKDILPTMLDSLKKLDAEGGAAGENLPSSVNFISGMSATADIELVRVEGVHGPMFVYYIIVE
ncbi:LutC/YkgG family protein [Curtanaerobium respiraculi]|uniref:LutC/YkgG family protein n=1 Tax=Curtanaerobium respiraculi TaxID=2949669 RepID=UPI0024B37108|nr:lactate utilization protein C [Curtanaerobium respiraculi]